MIVTTRYDAWNRVLHVFVDGDLGTTTLIDGKWLVRSTIQVALEFWISDAELREGMQGNYVASSRYVAWRVEQEISAKYNLTNADS